MIHSSNSNIDLSHREQIENYYRFHAPIYDATRWSFLFGRHSIIEMIPDLPSQPKILEIGCGTGTNILHLKNRFPNAQIIGLDLSDKMLSIAKNKIDDTANISLKNHRYGTKNLNESPFDLILLSYSLTMMGPAVEPISKQIHNDLKSNGYIAIVDFHTSPYRWFRHWMAMNHVDFYGHSLPLLKQYFKAITCDTHPAYFGLWSYYQFIGKPN